MIARWLPRNRHVSSRLRVDIRDVLVDENGAALIDENGRGLEAAHALTTAGLRDENGRVLVDEAGYAIITE